MAGRPETHTASTHSQMMEAFRNLYLAIVEVLHACTKLSVPDEELLPLMGKMDGLNNAFYRVRTIYSQESQSASNLLVEPPERCNKSTTANPGRLFNQSSIYTEPKASLEEKMSLLQRDISELKRSAASSVAATTSQTELLNGKEDLKTLIKNSEISLADVASLQTQLTNLGTTVQNGKELVNIKVDRLEVGVKSQSHRLDLLEALVSGFEQDRRKSTVAFYTKAVKTTRLYRPGDTLEFGKVIEDTAHSYDVTTSTFTVPSDGLYFLATSINLNTAKFFTAAISVNNKEDLGNFGTPATADLQTSTSVLRNLTTGDRVCVKVYAASSPQGVQPGAEFSNFMGFKIC